MHPKILAFQGGGMVGTAEEKPFISISSSGCFPANVLRVSEYLQIFIVQLCSFVA